jgi:hypothetical protein
MNTIQKDLEEINTFLGISYQLFDKKLSAIERAMITVQSEEKRNHLQQKAIQLHKEYKQTLAAIENYIDTL